MFVVSGRGNRQNLANRLDPMGCAMIVNKRDHLLNARSSSAIFGLTTGKICRCVAQYLIGLPQFPALAIKSLQPVCHVSGYAGPLAAVHAGVPHPVEKRLRHAADLRGN